MAGEMAGTTAGFTVTTTVSISGQPVVGDMVTVYSVVEVGETDFVAPAPKLLLQAYTLPPLAVSVTALPAQIEGVAGATEPLIAAVTVNARVTKAVVSQMFARATPIVIAAGVAGICNTMLAPLDGPTMVTPAGIFQTK